ncbi:aspartate--tRNA(Asn) ligase [Candidatus Kaiserbacteria bacterium RIFCSPHIGHO2_02_FULL_55_25]|uniref:Aspartate--tRNA ligase n=1 Tax=Candidatus Kaiserbacteria bacterium RIFCSPHIGHO2_02_FULL_55_25 TaxID=1798498 RepID=A0A1F6EAK6_9BACT|nr:MAG: aspartate--tRNA(Asn) ligase [Candidatus Kaiserbacteria bacterium RIFCSPHIGHO2_01_FULL_55_79]OGG70724.1 MAG: aspartate--tRNA(Asn) ligase [Candidatus Kaiserbacteria bacterium RIFCSPHIGHO2_02_FULL_55_25]OGG77110.1 MAG: aspartate--tRNA(Asn) ligase [Candidatus Kaiserbacteria bacterium RIFCSPHIGHO2_12_FULL_55_13]OGG84027.1 MAG: aspartate--tRNA(Asn) ligase [Candidatus Kaiserbacteria bacterium RIFCSPLOWO2_01_FULL_55_25]
MEKRTYIGDLSQHVGESVTIMGWVSVRRDQGKMVFFDFRDMTGSVQGVVLPKSAAIETAKDVRVESAVAVTGLVNKRPEKNVQEGKQNGDIELQIERVEVLGAAATLPFELGADLHLETHLDNLPLTLKTQRSRDIFHMQSSILDAYRTSLKLQGFTEFVAPALVGGDAEGGSAVFKVDYFNDKTAYLATSPQFYKQIMVGPFERAFTVAKIFRAERSATTRHLSEATCMDFEMGFIENEKEPMRVLEKTIKDTVKFVAEKHADIFERFHTSVPLVPDEIPILTLREAQDILGVPHEPDMEPENERQICEWSKKEKGSDFIFITRYPTKKRAFYTYEDPSESPYSRGFDLLFRGLEINSGAQRIHDHDTLVARMKERGFDPAKFVFYLQAFRYGMPPHGGSSTGLERFTARMLEIPNVKEATAFPRDMTRIDSRLSEAPEFES